MPDPVDYMFLFRPKETETPTEWGARVGRIVGDVIDIHKPMCQYDEQESVDMYCGLLVQLGEFAAKRLGDPDFFVKFANGVIEANDMPKMDIQA